MSNLDWLLVIPTVLLGIPTIFLIWRYARNESRRQAARNRMFYTDTSDTETPAD